MHDAFQPQAAEGVNETYEFRIGDEVFYARIKDGSIETGEGPAGNPDLVVVADPQTFLDLASKLPLAQAVASNMIRIEGDPAAVERLAQVFGLPTAVETLPASRS